MKFPRSTLCLVLLFCSAAVNAQNARPGTADDLPRRGIAGLIVAGADSAKPENALTNPPTVKSVVRGGAGEAAGIEASDTLVELDGKQIGSSASFAQEIGHHLAGEAVQIVLRRAGQEMQKTIVLKARPLESSPDATILYRSITAGGSRRRTIITNPRPPGRHPAVLLVGGLGCYSLDGALNESKGYGPILSALVQEGFVTMRVEKTGEGDSGKRSCELERKVRKSRRFRFSGRMGGPRHLRIGPD